MQDDANSTSAPIITVCTSGSPVGQAAAGGAGLLPGQAVLDERIAYLMEQQLPASAIPVCREAVAACPSGAPPASAGPEYLAARRAAMPAALLQAERRFAGGLMTSGSFTMMAAGGVDFLQTNG